MEIQSSCIRFTAPLTTSKSRPGYFYFISYSRFVWHYFDYTT